MTELLQVPGAHAGSRPGRSSSSCGLGTVGGVLRLGRPGSSAGSKRAGSCGMGRAAKVFQKEHQVATAENGRKVSLIPGQILLPAASAANDMLRMRNGGVRRGSVGDDQDEPLSPASPLFPEPPKSPKGLPPALLATLSRAESEAGSSRGHPLRESGACWGCGSRPQSPRMLNGKLRKSSLVEISYPGGLAFSPQLSLHRVPSSPASSLPVSRRPSSRGGDARSGDTTPVSRLQSGQSQFIDSEQLEREQSLKKSMRIMEFLYSVRRVGWRSEDQENPELDKYLQEPKSQDEQKSQDQLMLQVLRDTDDDEATLAEIEEQLSELEGGVNSAGGSRHATSVLAGRALAVVKRKRGQLKALDDSMRAFDEAQAQGLEIVEKLKQDLGYEEPEALVGMEKVLKSVIHKGSVEPSDENKVDFRLFSQTFGLSGKHKVFKQIKDKATKAMTWWAETALKEARAGADPAVVRRLLDISCNIMTAGDNADIAETMRLLGDTLAEKCLEVAEAVRDKDMKLAEASGKPEPESAKTAADFINKEITMVVAMGARAANPSLQMAKQIAYQLQQEEKDRLARRVFEYARSLKETDEINALTAKEAMKVGPALWAADSISKEVQKVRGRGVPEKHTLLVEARRLEQQLRDEDLGRRRTAGQGQVELSKMKGSIRMYKNVRNLSVVTRGRSSAMTATAKEV